MVDKFLSHPNMDFSDILRNFQSFFRHFKKLSTFSVPSFRIFQTVLTIQSLSIVVIFHVFNHLQGVKPFLFQNRHNGRVFDVILSSLILTAKTFFGHCHYLQKMLRSSLNMTKKIINYVTNGSYYYYKKVEILAKEKLKFCSP